MHYANFEKQCYFFQTWPYLAGDQLREEVTKGPSLVFNNFLGVKFANQMAALKCDSLRYHQPDDHQHILE